MKEMKSPLGSVVRIPSGATKAYKILGFVEVKKEAIEGEAKDNLKSKNDLFLEEVVQKPIGEWSRKDITRFLKIKGKEMMLKNEDGSNKSFEEAKKIVVDIINSEE